MIADKLRKGDWWAILMVALTVLIVVASLLALTTTILCRLLQKPEVLARATLEEPCLDFYAAGEGDRTLLVFPGEEDIRVYVGALIWFYDLEETEPEYLTGKWYGWPDNTWYDFEIHLHRSRPR